jgi:penicillin-insensitive murein endopeptidase
VLVLRALAIVAVLASFIGAAHAQDRSASSARGASQSRSRSVGAPNRGRLRDAVQIQETPDLVVAPSGHGYGTEELVRMIERSAARLRRESPGPRLLVGALSRPSGGRVPPHNSHQSGRDADLGFFLVDERGAAVEAPRFIDLDPSDQCGQDQGRTYCLDGARTFAFIAAMLDEPSARVMWVLLAADIQQRILAAGRRSGASDEVLRRVEAATDPRDGSDSHRNHLHVRIHCPADDVPGCTDGNYSNERPQMSRRERARRRRARRGRR